MQARSEILDRNAKKKTEQLRPASENEFRYAALLYHTAFDEELVDRGYTKQDLDYIIELSQKKLYIDELHQQSELGFDPDDHSHKPLH